MKWTEQKVFDHVAQYNGVEVVKLVKKLLETLKDDEFYEFGKGGKFPSIRLFVNRLSEVHHIIGIEF